MRCTVFESGHVFKCFYRKDLYKGTDLARDGRLVAYSARPSAAVPLSTNVLTSAF